MIKYLFESITAGAKEALNLDVEFKRVEEKCKPLAPAFLIHANGQPTNILFNTAILNNDKMPLFELMPKLIVGIIQQIAIQVEQRK
jgi:hypothetical protein